jgi:hypothetical protein
MIWILSLNILHYLTICMTKQTRVVLSDKVKEECHSVFTERNKNWAWRHTDKVWGNLTATVWWRERQMYS